jgi:RNA polymerase sigma factor (sigma-70 family)
MNEATVSREFGSGVGIARLYSDDRLARQAARGDERAFAAIFRRYHQGLYRLCLAIVGNPADAQDALQNTMVKVLRALPGEERRIELEPWLYRIARNESVELLRRRREPRQLDAELAAPGFGLAEEAASRERLRQLISDLDELPERQRGALVMRELAGLDFAEIGTALGTSAAVARQALYEARLSLRQMDEGREMGCEGVTRALSDGDGRVTRRRDIRAHLRGCAGCRRFRNDIEARERDFAALAPLPALAAAGILQGLLGGGGGGAGGGGLAATLGGGAAQSAGAAATLKAAAVVAAVGAIGVGIADRGGLVDLGLPGGVGPEATQAQRPVGTELARAHLAGAADFLGGAGAASAAAGGIGYGLAGPPLAAAGDGRAEAMPGTAGDSDAAAAGSPETETLAATLPETRADGDKSVPAVVTTPTQSPGPEEPDTVAAGEDPATTQEPSANQPNDSGSGNGGSSGNGKAKGHENDPPGAAEHGQQTAESKKGAEHGSGAPGHPSKPEHPVHPSNPGSEKGPPSSPPGQGGREEQPQAPSTPPPVASPPPAEEGPPGQGKGKGKKPQGFQ